MTDAERDFCLAAIDKGFDDDLIEALAMMAQEGLGPAPKVDDLDEALSALCDNAEYLQLAQAVVDTRTRWTEKFAQEILKKPLESPEALLRELDYRRGYFAGAHWISQLPRLSRARIKRKDGEKPWHHGIV